MKTLLSYIAVLSVGIICVCSTAKAQARQDVKTPYSNSLQLSNNDFSEVSDAPVASNTTVMDSRTQDTASLIYLVSITEAIDLRIFAFNQQNQSLVSPANKNLDSGVYAYMPDKKTNSRGVQLYPKSLLLLLSCNTFSPNVKALKRLPYETRGNWGVSPSFGG